MSRTSELKELEVNAAVGLLVKRQFLAFCGKVSPESIIHSDKWRGYNGLVDLGYKKHYRVHHGTNEFARGRSHIDEIESFWAFAKNRLSKFHGIPQKTFYLHLKECEFRFNYRNENLYYLLLNMFREKPLI